MKLHRYQENCLADLRKFLTRAAEIGAKSAYDEILSRPYVSAQGMPGSVPYICVRVPTGGGKTLMAAHTIGIAAETYSDSDSPVCLWIAPSTPIVQQTLRALRTPGHPYRRALLDKFNDINCLSISEAMRLGKGDMDGAATVIVATSQSFNVEETGNRKIYDNNDSLMAHFDSAPQELIRDLEGYGEPGGIFRSLANVLRMRSPIIISDEAHNNRAPLFYKSLARFNPSCIVEWTATPQMEHKPDKQKYASNVLSHVSARELKKAGMIKLPIHLEVNADWRDNIAAAIKLRARLEEIAEKEREYIRPIVLYQAEQKGRDATKEEVEKMLWKLGEELGVKKEEIAVHTGTRKELTGINLLSRNCKIRHIITVKSLAEGWDCSFAYILCTMANLQNGRPVEQVLGRILRMPYATSRRAAELRQCYAFSSSGSFFAVANALKEALINGAGCQHMDECELIPKREGKTESLIPQNVGASHKLPPKIGALSVPFLSVRESGELVFLESAHFLEQEWSIANEKPDMSVFGDEQREQYGEGFVDVNESGKVMRRRLETKEVREKREQTRMLEPDKNWSELSLAAWLDSVIEHPDIPQAQSSPFILAAVKQLAGELGFQLPELVRRRFYLKRKLEREIKKLRDKKRKEAYQLMLSTKMAAGAGRLEVSAERSLTFARHQYAMHWECKNPDEFGRHLFPRVGELKYGGEEWECARCLDEMPEVEVWVRNLDRRENSFWLQTSGDKFYPDFVCRLKDGRILVVEYKGEDRWSNDDSKEKRALGEMWAKLSGGKCLFVMPKGMNWNAIRECVAVKN